jgi:hypothetical protein
MSSNKNFDYLGSSFQIQLLNQIVVDKEFSRSIVDVIEPNYFDNKYFKIIIQMIKEYNQKWDGVPSFETLEQITIQTKFISPEHIQNIIDWINNDESYVSLILFY